MPVALLVGCAGCGGGGSGSPTPVSGSFVGSIPGTELYVAVVAAPPEGDDTSRAVRVYACDGDSRPRGVSEWFTGRGGDDLQMTSAASPARVRVALRREAAEGVLTLADGRETAFTARPATGIAGLYEVVVHPDGRVRGVSSTGVVQRGRVSFAPDAAGRIRGTGTYTTPDGSRTRWTSATELRLRRGVALHSRVIVLSDGSRRGAFKRRTFAVVGGNTQPPN